MMSFRNYLQFGGGILLILLFGVMPAFAATASIQPLTISPGDTIEVHIDGIPAKATMEIGIEASIATIPDEEFNFTVRDLSFEYDLDPAELTSTITGLSDDDPCKLYIKEPDLMFIPGGEVTRKGYPTNGTFEVQALQGIEPLAYQAFFTGTAAGDEVTVLLTLKGTKTSGPEDTRTSFNLEGFTAGRCTITIMVDGVKIKTDTVSIG